MTYTGMNFIFIYTLNGLYKPAKQRITPYLFLEIKETTVVHSVKKLSAMLCRLDLDVTLIVRRLGSRSHARTCDNVTL